MNIAEMSYGQLKALQEQIESELKKRRVQERKNTLTELRALAASRGYTIEELLSGAPAPAEGKASRGPVAIKYRHPADASLTWTGRGKRPRWVAEWLAQGNALESLAV